MKPQMDSKSSRVKVDMVDDFATDGKLDQFQYLAAGHTVEATSFAVYFDLHLRLPVALLDRAEKQAIEELSRSTSAVAM